MSRKRKNLTWKVVIMQRTEPRTTGYIVFETKSFTYYQTTKTLLDAKLAAEKMSKRLGLPIEDRTGRKE
jgi:hypothetical protein